MANVTSLISVNHFICLPMHLLPVWIQLQWGAAEKTISLIDKVRRLHSGAGGGEGIYRSGDLSVTPQISPGKTSIPVSVKLVFMMHSIFLLYATHVFRLHNYTFTLLLFVSIYQTNPTNVNRSMVLVDGPFYFISKCLGVAFEVSKKLNSVGLPCSSALSWLLRPHLRVVIERYTDAVISEIKSQVL
jgi:hypothetical protein